MGCANSREVHKTNQNEVAIAAFLTETQVTQLSFEFVYEQVLKLSRGKVIPKGSVSVLPMILKVQVNSALLRLLSECTLGGPGILSDKSMSDISTEKLVLFAALVCQGPFVDKLQALFQMYDKSRGGYLTQNEIDPFLHDSLWFQLQVIPKLSQQMALAHCEHEELVGYCEMLEIMIKPALENFTRQLMMNDRLSQDAFIRGMHGKHLRLLLDGAALREMMQESECPQQARYFCKCSTKTVFVCVNHQIAHIDSGGDHKISLFYQELTDEEFSDVMQAKLYLTQITQRGITHIFEVTGQVDKQVYNREEELRAQVLEVCCQQTGIILSRELHKLNTAMNKVLIERSRTRVVGSALLKMILSESRKKGKYLDDLLTYGLNMLTHSEGIFDGRTVIEWLFEAMYKMQLVWLFDSMHGARLERLLQDFHKVEKERAQTLKARKKAHKHFRKGAFAKAAELYQKVAQRQRMLALHLDLAVTLCELAMVFNRSGPDEARHKTTMRAIDQVYSQVNADSQKTLELLAVAALVNGSADESQLERQHPGFRQKLQRVRFAPIFTADRSAAYFPFRDSSFMCCLVAKHIADKLKIEELGPSHFLNQLNLVSLQDIRGFLVSLLVPEKGFFEPLLLDIVLQTRERNDLTQASVNALTLLHQLGYCFANGDFSLIKAPGANLSGANLMGADFSHSDLRSADLRGCTFLHCNFEHANLVGAKFENHLRYYQGHSHWVTAISFSSDCFLIASASGDHTIKLWEVASTRQIHTFHGHSGPVTKVCFSADDTLIASASWDQYVIVWNVATGHKVVLIHAHLSKVYALAFSGLGLISGSDDGAARVWDISTGQLLLTLFKNTPITAVCCAPAHRFILCGTSEGRIVIMAGTADKQLSDLDGHRGLITALSVSPNDMFFVSGSYDRTVILWDAFKMTRHSVFAGHNHHVMGVSFSPNHRHLATCGLDGSVCLWDIATAQRVEMYQDHFAGVRAVSFSPDGKLIASGSSDMSLIVRAVTGPQQLQNCAGHSKPITVLCSSSDGTLIASGSQDNTVIVWATTTGKQVSCLTSHSHRVTAICFIPGDAVLVTASVDRKTIVWETVTGNPIHILQGHTYPLTALCVSPIGDLVSSGCSQGNVIVWRTATGERVHTIKCHSEAILQLQFSPQFGFPQNKNKKVHVWAPSSQISLCVVHGQPAEVIAVHFSATEVTVASGNSKQVMLWDATTGMQLRELQGHLSHVVAVRFSSDGTLLASGSLDQIVVWETWTGNQLKTFRSPIQGVTVLCFVSNSGFLASSGEDRCVILWDLTTNEQMCTLQHYTSEARPLSFSSDAAWVASSTDDHKVVVWNATTGQQVHSLHGHYVSITAMCFSPDNSLLASASEDKRLILWDTAKGNRFRTLKGHPLPIRAICFSPSGSLLASGSDDQTVILWALPTGELLKQLYSHSHVITAVCFSCDEALLFSGSADKFVLVWAVSTGENLHSLQGHSERIALLVSSPVTILTASADTYGKVILWEPVTNRQVCTFQESSKNITTMSFSLDGTLIASCSDDRQVIVRSALTGQQFFFLQGISRGVRALAFSSSSTIVAISGHLKIVWDLSYMGARKTYSPDLKTLEVETENGREYWNVETGERLPNSPYPPGTFLPIVYPRVSALSIRAVLGKPVFQCYGTRLEGAVISQSSLDFLNSLR